MMLSVIPEQPSRTEQEMVELIKDYFKWVFHFEIQIHAILSNYNFILQFNSLSNK